MDESSFVCSCGWRGTLTTQAAGSVAYAIGATDRRGAYPFLTEDGAWAALKALTVEHRAGCDGAWSSEAEAPGTLSQSCPCGWRAALTTTGGAFVLTLPDRGVYHFRGQEQAQFALEQCAARHKGDCPQSGG
jgi:hypothetical protein